MSCENEPTKILFEIKNFLHDSSRREKSFTLANNSNIKFTLYCRPNCNLPDHDGRFTLIYLYLESSDKERVFIQYRMSIVNRYGKNIHVQGQEKFLIAYKKSMKYGGLYKIDQQLLLNTSYWNWTYVVYKLHEGSGPSIPMRVKKITFCCEIKEIEINQRYLQKPVDLIQNFQDLLESGNYADAVLFVEGKELKVHKFILSARSKVFGAMFEHDFEEKNKNRVEITDIQLDVCEELLRYIYTAKIDSIDKFAVELLVASDKYELEELKNECEKYLMENLSIETVADILLYADLHQANELKSKCISFISKNRKSVQNTSGWMTLTTKADLIAELYLTQRKIEFDEENDYFSYSGEYQFSDYNLKEDFIALFENGKFSDAVFILKDGEIRVHKNILSIRSKVFANIFEQEQDKVELSDVNIVVCKQLLLYIYSDADFSYSVDKFSLDSKYASELLILSEKFQLSGLKDKCEYKLSDILKIESVSKTLMLADKYAASYLKEKCFEFITANSRQVIQTEGWKVLTKNKPELVVQMYECNAANLLC